MHDVHNASKTQQKNINMEDNGEGSAENAVQSNLSDGEMREFERQAEVKLREKTLRQLLSPLEGFIMSVQSLLVWEKPARSAVMLLCVNGLFWLAVTTNYRVVFIAAVSGIIFVSMETIHTKVWPEIRVHQPDEDDEGWTPVHQKLLSLPELCEHMAKLWVTMERLNTRIWKLRREHPSKFCLYMSGLFLMLAAIGHKISGVFISYLIVTGLMLWPALEYHNISGHLYQCIEPILQQLDHSIDSPSRNKKLKSQRRSRSRSNSAADTDDSSDSDLDEFCPSPGPSVDAALAHAAAAGRSVRSSAVTSAGLFGGLSKGMSLDLNTDDEFTDTEPPSYMGGLSQVPSYDNTAWDQSADELEIDLPYDDHPPVPGKLEQPQKIQRETKMLESSEAMQFIPTHFRDSIEVDNEILEGELEFPDVDVDGKSVRRNSRGQQSRASEPLLPPAAAMLLSQAVTTVMSDALAILQDMSSHDDNSSTSEPSQLSQHRQQPEPEDTSVKQPASQPRQVTMDSDSADFEMLDRAELEQTEGGRGAEGEKDEVKPRSRSGYGIGFLTSWLSGKK